MRSIGVGLGVAVLLAMSAIMAEAEDSNRYSMEKSENGYVRMDRQTGEMSICQEQSGQLICRLAADDRAAFEDDVERLHDSISALEKRVAVLENAPSIPQALLPSQEDFDRSLGFMEQFLRRFMGIVKDLDETKIDPTVPQKTSVHH